MIMLATRMPPDVIDAMDPPMYSALLDVLREIGRIR